MTSLETGFGSGGDGESAQPPIIVKERIVKEQKTNHQRETASIYSAFLYKNAPDH